MPSRLVALLLCMCVAVAAGRAADKASAADANVDFNRDVRPILSDKCFACHGFDAGSRQADLRLDRPEEAAGVLVGTGAPGADPRQGSEVWARLISADPDVQMPPPEFGKSVTPAERETLGRWIDQGAAYQTHWAFEPILAPNAPPGSATWIDGWIDEGLRKEELRPAPLASPHSIARRVALDLVGLQADPTVLTEYLEQPNERGYRRLVDRLLADPGFGEHQARAWLDTARYGDTHGMARDDERSIWPYRDWVVASINDNQPIDRFTVEQLAGDRLDQPTLSQIVATGFLRCNVSTAEGGSIEQELRVRYAGDRTETLATTWLGLTVGCAACHDHKFDPISQVEHYRLAAFFADIDEEAMNGNALAPSPTVPVPSDAQARRMARIESQMAAIAAKLAVIEPPAGWSIDDIAFSGSAGGWQQSGPLTPTDNTDAYFDTAGAGEQADWRDVQGDRVTISSDNSATMLSRELTTSVARNVQLRLASNETLWKPLRITVWVGDRLVHWQAYRQSDVPFDQIIDLPLNVGVNRVIVRVSQFGGPVRATVELDAGQLNHLPVDDDAKHHRLFVDVCGREMFGKWLQRREASLRLAREIPVTMVSRPAATPRQTYVLARGQYDHPTDPVTPAGPAVLPPVVARNGGVPDRLDLARWLVDPQHPLPARVWANRLWQSIFGHGLVSTPEDFGTQGQPPTHPELLDRLATELIRTGWDRKRMLRQMVLADAYRRRSDHDVKVDDAWQDRDPENRFLAAGPSGRLSGETLRDTILQAAGQLDRTIGGRGVKPPQPQGLWEPVSQPNSTTARFVADRGGQVVRRSLYTFWKRTAPPPMMATFDAPTRESCTVRRSVTNTPMQALLLLNDPQLFAAAGGLARRASALPSDTFSPNWSKGDNDEDRFLAAAMGFALGRTADGIEQDLLRRSHDDYHNYFVEHPDSANQLASLADLNLPPAQAAARVMMAHTIFNLSEMVTRP